MERVIVVWNRGSDSAFEQVAPLEFNGHRNRRLGSKAAFHVLFLEGLDRLSAEYRQRLSGLGYVLSDAAGIYERVAKAYPVLARFGDYEQKCFLRWLVIGELYGQGSFVHYDADVVFNATAEEIEADLAGLTFVLQGCPALAQVTDASWLESYRTELNRFVADIDAYSAEAWRQRASFEGVFRERNGNLWERKVLSSDQDLLQFLTLSGRVPQADADTLNRRSSLALVSNPVVIGRDTSLAIPLRYERREGLDYINGRKMAFWHMQNDFCDYLGYATFLRGLGYAGRVRWACQEQRLSHTVYRAMKKCNPAYGRGRLVQRYFDAGSESLKFLLNGRSFWQPDVFE